MPSVNQVPSAPLPLVEQSKRGESTPYKKLFSMAFNLCSGRILLFLILSTLAALSEGFGILMLAPILEVNSVAQVYADNTIMGVLMSPFVGLSSSDRVLYAASAMIVFILLRGVLVYGSLAVGGLMPLEIQRVLSRKGYELLLGARIEFVQSLKLGDVGNFLLQFPMRTSKSVRSIAELFSSATMVLVYLGILFVVAGPIALVALFFIGVMYFIIKRLSIARIAQAGKTNSLKQSDINSLFVDSYQGISLLHLSGAENEFLERYKKSIEKLIKAMRLNHLLTASYAPTMTTVAGVIICLGLIGGAVLTDGGEGFVSRMLLFMVALYRMLAPVTSISAAHATMQLQMDSFVKLDQFFSDAEAARQPDGDREILNFDHEIKFENVHFSYTNRDDTALNGISLEIPRGKMIALVGPSGAGKSTIVHLLSRMYDVSDGQIVIDGIPLEEIRLSSWRKLIGVVSQDIILFNDTVYNNLTIGLENVSHDNVWAALEAASAKRFVEALPGGLDAFLGERGGRLSGGERQRMAIARTILANPEILILDEATSNLDSETEQAIQRLVEKFKVTKTVVVVAHRLSTIRRADTIMVMEDGKVVERGSHDELIKRDSKYSYMLNHQLVDLVSTD